MLPHLQAGQNVLVVARGNSLRAWLMRLEAIRPEAIKKVKRVLPGYAGNTRLTRFRYVPIVGEVGR